MPLRCSSDGGAFLFHLCWVYFQTSARTPPRLTLFSSPIHLHLFLPPSLSLSLFLCSFVLTSFLPFPRASCLLVSVVCPSSLGWPYFQTLAFMHAHMLVLMCFISYRRFHQDVRRTVFSMLCTPTKCTVYWRYKLSILIAGSFAKGMKEGVHLLKRFSKEWLSLWHDS